MITGRQWTAFRYVFSNGLTQEEAAEAMGISQQAVSKLIKKIRRAHPTAVPAVSPPKLIPYKSAMSGVEFRWWKITWSETAQIAAARTDKRCPVCLCNRKNGFVIKRKYGECWRCGWTFSFEDE